MAISLASCSYFHTEINTFLSYTNDIIGIGKNYDATLRMRYEAADGC